MTGTGTAADPFVADGLAIVVGGAADVGDTLPDPADARTRSSDMDVLISDPVAHRGGGADPHAARHAGNPGTGVDLGRRSARRARTRSCARR